MERREGETRNGREKREKTKLISGTEGESRCTEECSLTARRDYTRTVPLVLLPWFSESGSDRSMFPTFLSRTGALNKYPSLLLASELPRSRSRKRDIRRYFLPAQESPFKKTTTLENKHTPSAFSSVDYLSCVGLRPRVDHYGSRGFGDLLRTQLPVAHLYQIHLTLFTGCVKSSIVFSSPEEQLVQQYMKSLRSQVTTSNYCSTSCHTSTNKRAGEYQLGQITSHRPTVLRPGKSARSLHITHIHTPRTLYISGNSTIYKDLSR